MAVADSVDSTVDFIPVTDRPSVLAHPVFGPGRRAAEVVSNERLTDGVYRLVVRDAHLTRAKAAQFANLYPSDPSKVMPRPFGVAEVDAEAGLVSFVFAVVGKGTADFSRLRPGDTVDVFGPLGKGFDMAAPGEYLLVAGGLGVPPLLRAAQQLAGRADASATALIGYRDARFADRLMGRFADRVMSITNAEGNVIDLLDQWLDARGGAVTGEDGSLPAILSCGPHPMMQAVARWAREHGIDAQLSLEARMGCGYGACVMCVTPTEGGLRKVCLDGPVFRASELGW